MIQKEYLFEFNLNEANVFNEISKFVKELNKLAKEKILEKIIYLNGHTIGFYNGGKLKTSSKEVKESFQRFLKVDLVGPHSEPDGACFVAQKVALFALHSNGLSSQLKIGRSTKRGAGFSIYRNIRRAKNY